MRNTLVRVNATPDHRHAYVRHIGRDGGFSITYNKAKARAFAPATARELVQRLAAGITRMSFTTCEADHATHG